MKHLRMGCVAGRHDIKQAVDGYLFERVEDVHDYEYMRDVIERKLALAGSLDLYVTGLTAVTAEAVATCCKYGIELTLFHYDRETGEYKAQVIVSDSEAELLKEGK
ncbi:MAG: hypothetical protein Q3993_04660 [Filifactor alocis]|nr:hypothetical protein [Filifactor alocis]